MTSGRAPREGPVGATPERSDRRVRFEHWLDTHSERIGALLMRATKGRIAWRLFHRRVLVLTTTGRRTGRKRTVLVQFFPDGEDMIVVAANSGMPAPPGWYFNLMAHPRARVEAFGRVLDVAAAELSPEQADEFWPRVLEAAPDYARYPARTDRRIALVRLTPVRSDAPSEATGG